MISKIYPQGIQTVSCVTRLGNMFFYILILFNFPLPFFGGPTPFFDGPTTYFGGLTPVTFILKLRNKNMLNKPIG